MRQQHIKIMKDKLLVFIIAWLSFVILPSVSTASVSNQLIEKSKTTVESAINALEKRYRDTETGTFITRDPLGFVDGPNLYAYVVQNPWTHFDPHGLQVTMTPNGPALVPGNYGGFPGWYTVRITNNGTIGVRGSFGYGAPTVYAQSTERDLGLLVKTLGLNATMEQGIDWYVQRAQLKEQEKQKQTQEKLKQAEKANSQDNSTQAESRSSDRWKKELPPGETRTPEENKKARNYYKNNKDEARKRWENRTGETWPTDENGKPQWAEHPRPLKDGGDPLHVEPGEGPDPNAPHNVPGPDGKTDAQKWGAQGTPAREAKKKQQEQQTQSNP